MLQPGVCTLSLLGGVCMPMLTGVRTMSFCWGVLVTEVCTMSLLGCSIMEMQYKAQKTHSTWYLFEQTGYLAYKT